MKTANNKPRWKKLHAGTHYHFDGQVVKKGEILRSNKGDMSKVVQAGFQALDDIKEETNDLGKGLIVKLVSKGKYNVLNPMTMKPINETPISKKAAESFGVIVEDVKDVEEVKETDDVDDTQED